MDRMFPSLVPRRNVHRNYHNTITHSNCFDGAHVIATARDYYFATTAVTAGAAGAAVVAAGAAVVVVVVVVELVVAAGADAAAGTLAAAATAAYRSSGPASAPSGTVPFLAAGSVVTS